jgi:hypothetical protein
VFDVCHSFIVNRIPTRYKLTGPEGLTPETLQEALFDAARLLMQEDRTALMRVCQWFRTHGLVDLPGCPPGGVDGPRGLKRPGPRPAAAR